MIDVIKELSDNLKVKDRTWITYYNMKEDRICWFGKRISNSCFVNPKVPENYTEYKRFRKSFIEGCEYLIKKEYEKRKKRHELFDKNVLNRFNTMEALK